MQLAGRMPYFQNQINILKIKGGIDKTTGSRFDFFNISRKYQNHTRILIRKILPNDKTIKHERVYQQSVKIVSPTPVTNFAI